MSEHSKIEWTDATWNPIRGCSRVSEGCRNCYAEHIAARFSKPGRPYEGLAVMKDGDARWTGEVRFIEEHLRDPLHWKGPCRIFVNSMSDLFHEKVERNWIDRVLNVMINCPQHVFQILTKRPQRMREYMTQLDGGGWLSMSPVIRARNEINKENKQWPPPNVHLLVSAEDQPTADERIPLLLETPAAVRGISYEPALGPVDLAKYLSGQECGHPCDEYLKLGAASLCKCMTRSWPKLDWVICGGESGPGARPMHPDWARSVRDQCQAAGVPFFFKQWGEWLPWEQSGHISYKKHGHKKYAGGFVTTKMFREGVRGSSMPELGGIQMVKTGKKKAGRLLDGREWNEYPDQIYEGKRAKIKFEGTMLKAEQ